jgi:hypothetical protein
VNTAIQHLIGNWKTSLSGLLTSLIALGTYFTVTPSNLIPQKTVGILTLVVGAAKILLGLIQSDAKPSVTSSVTIEATVPVDPAKPKES